jgi:uncharacterized membrane protein
MKAEARPVRCRQSLLPHAFLAVAAGCLGLGITICHLETNGFWIDEVYSIHAASLPWGEMIQDRATRAHQPGYFALLKLWMNLLPDGWILSHPEVWLRLPSLVAYGVLIAGFAFWCRRVVGWRVALLAVAMMALHGLLLRQALEVRMYAMLTLVHGGLAAFWLRVLRRGAERPLERDVLAGLVGLSAAGGLLVGASHVGTFMIAVSALIVYGWGRKPGARVMMTRALIPLGSGLLAALPGLVAYFVLRYRREGALVQPQEGLIHGVSAITGILLRDQNILQPFPATSAIIPVAFLAAGLLLWGAWWVRGQRLLIRHIAWIALPLPVIFVVLGILALFGIRIDLVVAPRYVLPLVPWVSLLTAMLLLRILPRRRYWPLLTLWMSLLAFSATITTGAGGMQFREVARSMKAFLKPGDRIATVPHDVVSSLDIYLHRPGIPMSGLWRFERDRSLLRKQIRSLVTSDTQRLVFISFRGSKSRAFLEMEPTLGKAQWPAWGQGFGDLDVLIWDRANPVPH